MAEEHIGQRTTGPVFHHKDGRRYETNVVRMRLYKLFPKLDQTKTCSHLLRHCDASWMAELSIDEKLRKSRLGDSCRDNITPCFYTHISSSTSAAWQRR